MTQSNPGFYRHRIGDVIVTTLNDGVLEAPPEAVLLGISPADAATLLALRFNGPGLRLTVNAFLVQTGSRTILIDTGAGPNMGPGTGHLLENLIAAGTRPEQVDTVLLTHFHADHSGGLATPAGEAVFPNAQLAYAPAEADHWLNEANEAAAPEQKRSAFQAARKAAAPYKGRTQTIDRDALPGITRIPLPGHTPGHSGWQIGTGPNALLIWGDIMHVPDIQAQRPEVGTGFDTDPAQAIATRQAILARAAEERLLVAGMHLDFPAFNHVVKQGTAYALIPETWRPEPG